MFNTLPPLWRSVPVLVVALATSSANAEIWAITDSAHPLSAVPAGVRVIKLDDQQRIEEQLSRHLPADPAQAAMAARQMISSPSGRALTEQLAVAQQGVADAWSVRVEKIPAVVLDRRYVVYGQPNVTAAINAIEQQRRK